MPESSFDHPESLSGLYDRARLAELGVSGSDEALTDGTMSLTWDDAIDHVDRVAASLRDAGVEPGDRVAVRLPKSVWSFVAVHAVLRAGAVMVPLDPSAPDAVVAAVIDDAGAVALVTDHRSSSIAVGAEALGLSTIIVMTAPLDDAARVLVRPDQRVVDADELASFDGPAPTVRSGPDDPAYVIYTSGSTGRPKGIVHTHASALAYATTAASVYGLTRHDRFANIAPLHFDQSTFELYAAPLVGATVLVVPDPVLRFPASLTDLVARERISVWYSVPYLLTQISTRGVLAERDLGALRWVLYGGEAFPPGQLAALMRRLPGVTFSNVYGPAEVNQCTVHDLTELPDPGEPVPIGRAWPAARLRVVDPDDETSDAAVGTPGHLLVASATMMAGYWNRADLTDAAIVRRPRVDGEPVRWYRTGDLVVERPDGELVFVGRLDNQIKLRGHRIELEAIDALLGDLDLVEEGAVVVERSDDADDRLVAVVVTRAGIDDDDVTRTVLAALRERLPRYAVPSDVVVAARLPRTATGKIDRNAAGALA